MEFFDETEISIYIADSGISNYDIEIREIPSKYKNLVLISGKEEFYRSGDYKSLPESWVIVKHKGKYGVIDVRDSENPVLPFIYDKIEGNTTHLTLHKKGLKCHYPISDTPRYKELDLLYLGEYFIRFTLLDERKGWLLKMGRSSWIMSNYPKNYVIINSLISIRLSRLILLTKYLSCEMTNRQPL